MKLTGAQILWECLVREGVTEIFGYPGGAILPAYDAMLFRVRLFRWRGEDSSKTSAGRRSR